MCDVLQVLGALSESNEYTTAIYILEELLSRGQAEEACALVEDLLRFPD